MAIGRFVKLISHQLRRFAIGAQKRLSHTFAVAETADPGIRRVGQAVQMQAATDAHPQRQQQRSLGVTRQFTAGGFYQVAPDWFVGAQVGQGGSPLAATWPARSRRRSKSNTRNWPVRRGSLCPENASKYLAMSSAYQMLSS